MSEPFLDVAIDRLGHRGDGIAENGLFVPFVLPGERVRIAPDGGERAHLVEIIEPSADRIAPVCIHFGTCGGCALQHARDDAYRIWKRDLVVAALGQRGLEAPVEDLIPCPPRSRRRATFAVRWGKGGVELGFHERASHRLVSIEMCPVLDPRIERASPSIARFLSSLKPPREEASATILASDDGLDLSVEGVQPPKDSIKRAAFVAEAARLGLARVTVSGDTIVVFREPRLKVGECHVVPPPGGFVQAVAAAEEEMGRLVLEGVGAAKRAADLFAGSGAFALRLAAKMSVHAVEGECAAAAAIEKATRRAASDALHLKAVTVEVRDLFRRPLMPAELARFDAVVFDPPRVGAEDQAARLAASRVPRVVAVSCNPATFARDARILVDGGYELTRVVPIDQFLYAPHVELVAHFVR